MSNTQEKYDQDAEYLYAQAEKLGKKPTEAQEQSFSERVSIMVIDGRVDEKTARRLAFTAIFDEA